jgi:hypothetical protein
MTTRYCIAYSSGGKQPGLLQGTAKRANRDVSAELTRHGDGAGLVRVVELTMTSARTSEHPAVILERADWLPNLHFAEYRGRFE